jgi:catechol 2,3-dioxygenase-like lactoylglutathione lyase family enzyme
MSLPADASACTFVLTMDRAKAQLFYENVLGLRQLAEDDHALTYDLGGGVTMRLTNGHEFKAQPHTVLGWTVEDIRATLAALRAKGVTFNIYDGFGQDEDGVWTVPGGGVQVAWFPDPDGNVLSLTQFG